MGSVQLRLPLLITYDAQPASPNGLVLAATRPTWPVCTQRERVGEAGVAEQQLARTGLRFGCDGCPIRIESGYKPV